MSCSNVITAVQACVEVLVGLNTTAVAALSLRYMPSLYTGSICESEDALCRSICTYLFLLDLGLCVSAEYSSWWLCPVVSGEALLLL